MRSWMALLALAPACGFSSSPGGNGGPVDAGRMCYGTIIPICFPASAVPTTPTPLGSTAINTDLTALGSDCDQSNDQKDAYCVVVGAGLTLPADATLTAYGSKPLVLLSTGMMDLAGSIDVGSHQSGMPQLHGAGANPTASGACSFATSSVPATMGGGGAGASFGTQGGSGGDQGIPAAGGGRAGSKLDTFPAALRGGCKGGDGAAIMDHAAGGDGGGAIALIAVQQISVNATINASGGGGHGGAAGAANGGGGGGSGGMIVFDSLVPPTFGANVKLWANGGAGGQGSSIALGGAAGGESSDPGTSGSGASGILAGGIGGDGSVDNLVGGKGANSDVAGGGGGGGGGGFIHAPGFTDPASISPPSSDSPTSR